MIAKKLAYLILALVVCGLVYFGLKLTSRSAYESADYSVIETDGSIELRSYPDLMLATTDMGTRVDGKDGSFGRLFQYISGGNTDKQKVAMTTPVFMEPKSDQTDGQMSFVIPQDVSENKIPEPVSGQVRLTKRLAGMYAVIRFAGHLDPDVIASQKETLKGWTEARGYLAEGEAEIAGYDPP